MCIYEHYYMRRELLPSQKRLLKTLGEQIRYARLRRGLTTVQIAERAGGLAPANGYSVLRPSSEDQYEET